MTPRPKQRRRCNRCGKRPWILKCRPQRRWVRMCEPCLRTVLAQTIQFPNGRCPHATVAAVCPGCLRAVVRGWWARRHPRKPRTTHTFVGALVVTLQEQEKAARERLKPLLDLCNSPRALAKLSGGEIEKLRRDNLAVLRELARIEKRRMVLASSHAVES